MKKTKHAATSDDFLNDMVDELIKEAGAGTAQLLGSDGLAIKIRGVISTQCPAIDHAIGRGGIPYGRLTILHGAEGSGKTTLALHVVAECQRMGGVVLYMDKEYKLDPDYAAALGVDTKRLIISQPPYLERAFSVMEIAIKKARMKRESGVRVPILIVLDSMNAAISKSQYDGDWDDQHYAPGARVYSSALPKLIPLVSSEDVSLLFISQVRKKIGVTFGDDNEVAGGNAPKFYASLIMFVTNKGGAKEGDVRVGNKTEIYVKKNQIAPPFKKAEFEIVYGKGIVKELALLDAAISLGVVKLAGAWYSFDDERFACGRRKASQELKANAKLYKAISVAVAKVKS